MSNLSNAIRKLLGTELPSPRVWTAGTDWGSYLYWDEKIQFDWDILVPAGIRFCVHKSDQEQLDPDYGNYSTVRNMQAAQDAGVLVNGTYSWLFPHVTQKYWIDRYKTATEREQPDFISVDAEQVSYYGDDGLWHIPPPNQVADNLLALCEGYSSAFPELPFLLYTRPGWITEYAYPAIPYLKWEYFMAGWPDWGSPTYPMPLNEIINTDMRQVLTYTPTVTWRMVNLIRDGFVPPKVKPTDVVRIWQTSSRMLPVYAGKTAQATHQYDWGFYLGDEADMLAWAHKTGGGGGEVTPPPEIGGSMAGTWKQTVKQEDRAAFIALSAEDKYENMPEIAKYVPAVMLTMGGADGLIGGGNELYTDSAFAIRAGRAKQVNVPVMGLFNLSAAWHLWKEHMESVIMNAPYRENKILEKILSAWRKIPLDYANLSATDGNWHDLKALVLFQNVATRPSGDVIPEPWARITLQYAVKFLDIFMRGGNIPNIPIYVMGTPSYFEDHNGEYANTLYNMLQNRVIAGVGIADPVLATAPMATVCSNMGAALAYRPSNDYKYPFVPYGFESSVVFHLYTYGRLLSPEVTGADGKPSPFTALAWCDTVEEMGKTLGFTPGSVPPPPPPPPPVELAEVIARVEALEDTLTAFLVGLQELLER